MTKRGGQMETVQIRSRKIDDPSMTDSEFLFRWGQEHDKARAENRRPDLNNVRVWAQENAMTRIGALCFIRRKLEHHERAAEWFKSAYEALYGAVSPAIDMAKVRVDTSIMAHDNGLVARIDQGAELLDLIVGRRNAPPVLAKPATDRVVSVVVFGDPIGTLAEPGPSGKPSGHAIQREVDMLLGALDVVAERRGFKMRAA